jgi:secreted PhoX family phosphatase
MSHDDGACNTHGNRPFAGQAFDGNNAAIHDAREDMATNPSGNRPFADVLEANLSRRVVMRGTLAAAVAAILAPQDLLAKSQAVGGGAKVAAAGGGNLCNFAPVSIADYAAQSAGGTVPVISSDYEYQTLIPWGTPIKPGVPEYAGDPNTRPLWTEQEQQIGIGHDGMWLFPENGSSNDDGMLCINHEFGTNSHLLGKSFPETLDDVRLSQAGHGCSVVRVAKDGQGMWGVVFDDRNRRITVNTPVEFDGPVAGTPFLANAANNQPLGTVNNCGNGYTPWGTYLTCEENFNGYFGWNEESFVPNEKQARYGFSSGGFGYGWHEFDDRFDLSNPDYANEYNRFGWIVEIDPQNPNKAPVKHTALGCFKHEGIAIRETRTGKIHCYMGDDQRFDYCYKFVSKHAWRKAISRGESPLAEGTLYVARFNDDGTGDWLELSMNNPQLATRFSSQAELLVNTRIAADIVGATPMDRPEWTTLAADGESVFWTLTNNSRREEPNAANPEAPNNDGHIIRTRDRGEGNGKKFDWAFFILASQTRGTEGVFTDPDAAYADREGRLFIGTDGGQPDGLQDQLTVFDTTEKLGPGELPTPKRLFVGVNSDEITGWAQTPDQTTAMINMQHPGDGNPDRTNFPAPTDGSTIPRDCTIVITRKDGGTVGS